MCRRLCAVGLLITVIAAVPGCSVRKREADGKRIYHQIVEDIIPLYSTLHPLRCSTLGLERCDSLLFTFSAVEIEESVERLRALLDRISSLPAGQLDEHELDDSAVIIDWIRGELFALDELQLFRKNPLLYCWMAEEALFCIPCRPGAPGDDERGAYEKRLGRVPALLENAAILLEKPAEIHRALASERLSELIDRFDELRNLASERYGAEVGALGPAFRSIERFRRFVSEQLAARPAGSFILGTENLSRIFQYDEHISIDPNKTIEECNRTIRTLHREVNAIRIRLGMRGDTPATVSGAPPEVDDIDSHVRNMLEEIDKRVTPRAPFGPQHLETPSIIIVDDAYCLRALTTIPTLSIPAAARGELRPIHPSLFTEPPCRLSLAVSETFAFLDEPTRTYRLLERSAPVRVGLEACCSSGDTVRVLLPSETFREGWRYHAMMDVLPLVTERSNELSLRFATAKIRSLACAVVVLQLHAGTFTTDAAVGYLVSAGGFKREEALSETLTCSVSPAAAYPGLSILLIENMTKRASAAKNIRKPRETVRHLLLEYRGLPLPLVLNKIPTD